MCLAGHINKSGSIEAKAHIPQFSDSDVVSSG